ncbi:MAG: ComEA family DNA-binding protein [Candidatus Eremiobacteraeota bacterium]|nr:ComEA family DNA-binding protein [Candidatus Eremiobacteraeota bacterium]MBV9646852.1 ComEA family DNA-binding protein [Candidatus Eremiobacteraeota bacterium]
MKLPVPLAAGAIALAAAAALLHPKRPQPATAFQQTSSASTLPAQRATRAGSRVVVYVAGEVRRPGVYTLASGTRVQDALHAADGPSSGADLLAINLAEPVTDGEKVLVPQKGSLSSAEIAGLAGGSPTSAGSSLLVRRHRRGDVSAGATAAFGHRSRRSHKTPPAQPIDLNAADETQLEQLPGIGPSLASRIVTFREVNGPYHSVDELLDVAGMTDRRLQDIDPYVTVRN